MLVKVLIGLGSLVATLGAFGWFALGPTGDCCAVQDLASAPQAACCKDCTTGCCKDCANCCTEEECLRCLAQGCNVCCTGEASAKQATTGCCTK
jgi:hypothetical protein